MKINSIIFIISLIPILLLGQNEEKIKGVKIQRQYSFRDTTSFQNRDSLSLKEHLNSITFFNESGQKVKYIRYDKSYFYSIPGLVRIYQDFYKYQGDSTIKISTTDDENEILSKQLTVKSNGKILKTVNQQIGNLRLDKYEKLKNRISSETNFDINGKFVSKIRIRNNIDTISALKSFSVFDSIKNQIIRFRLNEINDTIDTIGWSITKELNGVKIRTSFNYLTKAYVTFTTESKSLIPEYLQSKNHLMIENGDTTYFWNTTTIQMDSIHKLNTRIDIQFKDISRNFENGSPQKKITKKESSFVNDKVKKSKSFILLDGIWAIEGLSEYFWNENNDKYLTVRTLYDYNLPTRTYFTYNEYDYF